MSKGGNSLSIDEDKISGLAEVYETLVDVIGVKNTEMIYENFRGQQIVFPMRLYKKEFIEKEIARRYDGNNLKELAMEYGYSEGYLRKLLSKGRER